jgi:hypothetical protein
MSTAFKAIVVSAKDESETFDVPSQGDGKFDPAEVKTLKSARFTIRNNGPCPWPPSLVVGKDVVIMGADAFRIILERAGETELIKKLWPPRKPASTEDLV